MRGLKLIMWPEGQWEASKKTAPDGTDRQTHTHTDGHGDSMKESAKGRFFKNVNFEANIVFNVQCQTVGFGQNNTIQYSTVQYSTVQYSTVQYSTVKYSKVQCSTVMYSKIASCQHYSRVCLLAEQEMLVWKAVGLITTLLRTKWYGPIREPSFSSCGLWQRPF